MLVSAAFRQPSIELLRPAFAERLLPPINSLSQPRIKARRGFPFSSVSKPAAVLV
jgi:hypothetical protein